MRPRASSRAKTCRVKKNRAKCVHAGVTGIHPQAGLSTGDLEEAHIKRALIASASETYVLVSAEKLNAASPYVIASITEVDGMIVEPAVAAESLVRYEREGFSVLRA